MYEYVGNMHMHTIYSDADGTHEDIARAAIQTGLDFVVVTDRNIWINGMDGYRYLGEQRVLLLVGEEIYDQTRSPQKNHMLVFEAGKELSHLASQTQSLLDAVYKTEGLSFLAHPVDSAAPAIREPDLSWVDWEIDGYSGIELWNAMSEFKSLLKNLLAALYYAYRPERIAHGPFPETLKRWDRLLISGKRVVAIGSSGAFPYKIKLGPFRPLILPYQIHFKTINTHILTDRPLTGNVEEDRHILFDNLRQGHCFIGYDLPASTRGFRFMAQSDQGEIMMGDTTRLRFGITLQIQLPQSAEVRLLRDGKEIRHWPSKRNTILTVTKPGIYRVEVYIFYKGKRRGWIFSNPIFVTE